METPLHDGQEGMRVTIYYPAVAQKSYSNERRLLTPAPMLWTRGYNPTSKPYFSVRIKLPPATSQHAAVTSVPSSRPGSKEDEEEMRRSDTVEGEGAWHHALTAPDERGIVMFRNLFVGGMRDRGKSLVLHVCADRDSKAEPPAAGGGAESRGRREEWDTKKLMIVSKPSRKATKRPPAQRAYRFSSSFFFFFKRFISNAFFLLLLIRCSLFLCMLHFLS
jgi:hypothetical protein